MGLTSKNAKDLEDAKFIISINEIDLDKVLIQAEVAYIDVSEGCSCGSRDYMTPQKLIRVYNNTKGGITNRMMLKALIREGYEHKCQHYYFEGFERQNKGMPPLSSEWVAKWGS